MALERLSDCFQCMIWCVPRCYAVIKVTVVLYVQDAVSWIMIIYLMFRALFFGVLGFLCFQKSRSVGYCDIQRASNSSGTILDPRL